MAINRAQDSGLRPMSELSNYQIEQGDPDPRGRSVVGTDGERIGNVVDLLVDTSAMKVRYLLVDVARDGMAGDGLITLDVDDVDVRTSGDVLTRGHAGHGFDASAHLYDGAYAPSAGTSLDEDRLTRDEDRLTRTEEEVSIGKREVSRGEVRIGKHVETERVSQPVTRTREEVVIERRPVEAGRGADAATIGEAEIRVPLMEEEVVVEKRPVVKEELVVGKRTVEDRDVVETEVRREEFDIDKSIGQTSRDRSGARERH